jgi:hypothetical protein
VISLQLVQHNMTTLQQLLAHASSMACTFYPLTYQSRYACRTQ